MVEKGILYLIAALITFGGIFIFKKPEVIASFLKSFYSKYPLVQYAGEKQLTNRPVFIRLLGIVIIFVGLACIFEISIK